jgi:hypothetical protein
MQGDPRLVLGPDGSRLVFNGGQPAMDRGLENLVLISLFTSPGWVGNRLLGSPIGSDFETECNKPITRSQLNRIRNAAELALAVPVLGRVTVGVRNPAGHRLEVGVLIERTGVALKLSRDGVLWGYQATDPAHRRLVEGRKHQFWDDGLIWDDNSIWEDTI